MLCLVGHGLEVTPESITFLYEQFLPQSNHTELLAFPRGDSVVLAACHLRSEKLELAAWELLDAARCDSAGLVECLATEAMRSSGRN